jgi:hypothetical protein
MSRSVISRSHGGAREVAGLVLLYVVYEIVRGFGGVDFDAARLHTADIVSLERSLHLFGEQALQRWAEGVSGLPAVLGIAYLGLHFVGTAAALVWVHRSRRAQFALVRTTLVVTTAFALVGSLYNPVAAVPSLHFGYALIVGLAIAALARPRSIRIAGALYPVLMLLVIVATGNHFFFDAAAGGLVVVAGWLVARTLVRPVAEPVANARRAAPRTAAHA